jgi:hypothetical protein
MEKDKKQVREEKKQTKLNAKLAKEAERKAQQANDLELYGRQIASEFLSMGTVTIYEKGYVTVGSMLFGKGQYEKLQSFQVFSDNLTKKTGLGRTAGAVLTLGLNLASPNMRGNLLVTIVTDKQVHTGDLLPQVQNIKSVQRLEAAANAVLGAVKSSASSGNSDESLSASLEKLAALRDSGALSEAEFKKAKNKLIG